MFWGREEKKENEKVYSKYCFYRNKKQREQNEQRKVCHVQKIKKGSRQTWKGGRKEKKSKGCCCCKNSHHHTEPIVPLTTQVAWKAIILKCVAFLFESNEKAGEVQSSGAMANCLWHLMSMDWAADTKQCATWPKAQNGCVEKWYLAWAPSQRVVHRLEGKNMQSRKTRRPVSSHFCTVQST